MVQPVPPVMLGCWGTPVGGEGGQWGPARPQGGQELAGTEEGEDPGVLVPKGRGWASDSGGKQKAAPASGSQGLPSCAVIGDATRGDAGLGELSAGHARTQAASSPPGACSPAPATSPGPSPGAGEGTAPTQQHGQTGNRRDVLEGSA